MGGVRLILILSLLFLSGEVLAQGVAEIWVVHYNHSGSGVDEAEALAVDDSGNVYVAGRSGASELSVDYATIKYSPNGDSFWVRRYNGPGNGADRPTALAVDLSGNVYVTGFSLGSGANTDYATIKYAPNGETLWTRRYDGPDSSFEIASALAVDVSGNVYVTGGSPGVGTNDDFATIKYDSNGDSLWVARYNGPGNFIDQAQAVTADDSGNVYVTGYSWSATSIDYATIKYAPTGDSLWVKRYDGPTSGDDKAVGLAVDGAGNVYITGESPGSGTGFDYATIKYAPNGDTLWIRRYNGPANGDDRAEAVALDDSGNVYVTGWSQGSGTGIDYATIKYAPSGDTVWVRRYNGPPGSSSDQAFALAIDDSGNACVTGRSLGIGTSFDYATINYAPDGDSLWVKRYNGPGNGPDRALAVAADNSRNTYVTGGITGSGTGLDFATIKYSPCVAKPGDANASGSYTLGDVIATVNYIFNKPGCTPQPLCWLSNLLCRGDWDGGGTVSLSDVIRAVNYIFNKPGGPWNALPVGVCCLP